jgi:DNA-binding XRE family transcriptional regulator
MSGRKAFCGKRLRDVREAAGFSREQVAVAVRRSWNSIYQYERSEMRPSTQTQADLAAFFGCRIDDFYIEGTDA